METVIDTPTLAKWLDDLGFVTEPHGDQTFRCRRDTAEGEVVVFVRLSEAWLIASVVPFLATSGDNPFELARWLLRMNRDMQLRKFAYDEDGDVVLTVEVPVESLDFSEAEEALLGLVADAVKHRGTLRLAAAPRT
jgi:sensor domain CHASE-containing protein